MKHFKQSTFFSPSFCVENHTQINHAWKTCVVNAPYGNITALVQCGKIRVVLVSTLSIHHYNSVLFFARFLVATRVFPCVRARVMRTLQATQRRAHRSPVLKTRIAKLGIQFPPRAIRSECSSDLNPAIWTRRSMTPIRVSIVFDPREHVRGCIIGTP
jgi:hypothetical protein